jgi:hypothetical protein
VTFDSELRLTSAQFRLRIVSEPTCILFVKLSTIRMRRILFLLIPVLVFVFGCEKQEALPVKVAILEFALEDVRVLNSSLDSVGRTISLVVPYQTELKRRRPIIRISEGATVVPASGIAQDFTKPVLYTLIGSDGKRSVYKVIVESEIQPNPVIRMLEKDTLEAGFSLLITGHHFGDFPLDVSTELLDRQGASHPVSNQYLDSTRLRLSLPLGLEPGAYAIKVYVKNQSVVSASRLQVTYPAPQLMTLPRRNLRQGDTLLLTGEYVESSRYHFSIVLSGAAKIEPLPVIGESHGQLALRMPNEVPTGSYQVDIQNDTEKKRSRQSGFSVRIYDRNLPFITGLIEPVAAYHKGGRLRFRTSHFEAFPARFYQIQFQGTERSYAVNGIYKPETGQLTVDLPTMMQTGTYRVTVLLVRDGNSDDYRIDLDAGLMISD